MQNLHHACIADGNLSARIAASEDVKLKLVAVLQLEALTRPLLPQAAPRSLFVCLCPIFAMFFFFVVVLLLLCDIFVFRCSFSCFCHQPVQYCYLVAQDLRLVHVVGGHLEADSYFSKHFLFLN